MSVVEAARRAVADAGPSAVSQRVGSFAVDASYDSDATDVPAMEDPELFPATIFSSDPDVHAVAAKLTWSQAVVEFRLFTGIPSDVPISLTVMHDHVEALFTHYGLDGRDWNWAMNFTVGLHDKTPRAAFGIADVKPFPTRAGRCCQHVFLFVEVVGPPSLGSSMKARTVWTLGHADFVKRVLRLNVFNRELTNVLVPLTAWAHQADSALVGWKVRVDGAWQRYSGDAAASGRSAYATMQYYLEHRVRTGDVLTCRLPARVRGYRPPVMSP